LVNQAYNEPVGTIAVFCPTTSICMVVGNADSTGGDMITSSDGGSTWTSYTVNADLYGVDAAQLAPASWSDMSNASTSYVLDPRSINALDWVRDLLSGLSPDPANFMMS
jgi:hypothetical protein